MIVRKPKPGRTEIPRNPVIDTTLLLDFLVWRFSVSFGRPNIASQLQYLKTDGERAAMEWYLSSAKPVITSPGVIAEIHGLVQSRIGLRQPLIGSFWEFAREELLRLGLDEELVRLLEMDSGTLSVFGPTDTAILKIATSRD